MPRAAPRPCSNHPKILLQPGEQCSYCGDKKKQQRRQHDKRRGSSSQRGYDYRWQKAREQYLKENPLCQMECADNGLITPSTVVDHIKPHKGNAVLFWNRDNWQAGCKQCHDRKTAREDGGFGN